VLLRWRPVRTPARSAWLLPGLLAGLALVTVLLGWKALPRKA
jgi:hypothetical protein